jgi:hypothetical protein
MPADAVADVVFVWADGRVVVDTLVSLGLAVAGTLRTVNANTASSFPIKGLLFWTLRRFIGCTKARLFVDGKASRTLRRTRGLAHTIIKLEGGLADGVRLSLTSHTIEPGQGRTLRRVHGDTELAVELEAVGAQGRVVADTDIAFEPRAGLAHR